MVYIIVLVLAVLAMYGSYRMLGKDPLTDRDFAVWYVALLPELSSMISFLDDSGNAAPPDRQAVQKQAKRVRSLIAHLEDFEFDGTTPSDLTEIQVHLHHVLDSLEQAFHGAASPFFHEGTSRYESVTALCTEARAELTILENNAGSSPHHTVPAAHTENLA